MTASCPCTDQGTRRKTYSWHPPIQKSQLCTPHRAIHHRPHFQVEPHETQALTQTTQTRMKWTSSLGVAIHHNHHHHPGCKKQALTPTDSSLGVVLHHHRHKGNTWAPTRNSLDQRPARRHPFSHPQTTDTARDSVDRGAPPRRRHPLATDHLLRLREVEESWRQCTAKRRPTTC